MREQNHSLSRCSSHVVWLSDIVVRIYSNSNDHRNDRGTYRLMNSITVTATKVLVDHKDSLQQIADTMTKYFTVMFMKTITSF